MGEGKSFTVTEQHLALLRRANVEFGGDEWGAPAINGKRPYGNGDLVDDICRILGWPGDAEDPKVHGAALALHEETATALECVLRTGSFRPGRYVTSSPYTRDWGLA